MEIPASVKSVAKQIVDVQQALAGKNPGFRTAHAKGIVGTGTFVAGPEARSISKAAHLQGQSIPATIRFSNGSGKPHEHDGLPDVRALAVKFALPDGKKTDLLAITNEAFLARTAEEFLAFLKTNLPDPATGQPDPQAVPRFIETHPAVGAFVGRLMQKPVPASYAQAALPRDSCVPLHRGRRDEPLRPLSLGARGGRGVSQSRRLSQARSEFPADGTEIASRERTGLVSFDAANRRSWRYDQRRHGRLARRAPPGRNWAACKSKPSRRRARPTNDS